jgi:hypothetical protein
MGRGQKSADQLLHGPGLPSPRREPGRHDLDEGAARRWAEANPEGYARLVLEYCRDELEFYAEGLDTEPPADCEHVLGFDIADGRLYRVWETVNASTGEVVDVADEALEHDELLGEAYFQPLHKLIAGKLARGDLSR